MNEFIMPSVELGDIVKWYPGADRSTDANDLGYVGIVTGIGMHTINVNVFSPSSYNCMIKDGCRHMEDPRCQHPDVRSQGGWEHTPQTVRLQEALAKLAEICEQLGVPQVKRGPGRPRKNPEITPEPATV